MIQLAKNKGLKTVNLIRPREDWDAVKADLAALGADVVTTEARARDDAVAAGLPPAALGLNCVGGSSAVAVAKMLRDGATLVTYGAMGLQPVTMPASLLIFRDIRFRGFWLSGRYSVGDSSLTAAVCLFDSHNMDHLRSSGNKEKKAAVLDRVIALIREGKLKSG